MLYGITGHTKAALFEVCVLGLPSRHTQHDTGSTAWSMVEREFREGSLYLLRSLSHTLRYMAMSDCAEASVAYM